MDTEQWIKLGKMILTIAATIAILIRLRKVYKAREGIMLINKAYKLSQKGNLLRAIEMYKRALEMETPNIKKEDLCLTVAATCENAGMNEDALHFIFKALSLNPKNALAYRHMGIACSNLGRRNDSIRAYKKSLDIDPTAPNTWVSYATQLLIINNIREAINALEKAISLDSSNGSHYTGLAYAYTKIYDIASAEKYLKLAKKHGDNGTQYAKNAIQKVKDAIIDINKELTGFGLDLQELLQRIDRFETETRKDYIRVYTSEEKCMEKDSKFGGMPYQGADFTWPSDIQGNPMGFLAQLNFKQMPYLDGFPTEGILQFFIAQSLSLEHADHEKQETIQSKVVFYPHPYDDWNIKVNTTQPSISDDFPIRAELKLSFETASETANAYDFRFTKLFKNIVGVDFDDLPDVIIDMISSKFQSGHKVGGYPLLCQRDPRGIDMRHTNHTVQLLQIDSDAQAQIMWGDNGACSFLITPADLSRLYFDNTLFIWDCY